MKKVLSILLIFLVLSLSMCMTVQAASTKLGQLAMTTSFKDSNYSKKIFIGHSYKIPNLDTSFVPQGLCQATYSRSTYGLITAYDKKNKEDSRIYIMDSNGKLVKEVKIEDSKGQHVGGITEYKDKIWIVSTKIIYIINKSDLFNFEKRTVTIGRKKVEIYKNDYVKPKVLTKKNMVINTSDKVADLIMSRFIGEFSYCTTSYDGEYIWIGSYTSNSNKTTYANAFKYENGQLKHCAIMETPFNRCQGMCFDGSDKVYISSTREGALLKFYSYIWVCNMKDYKNEVSLFGDKYSIPYIKLTKIEEIKTPSGIEGIYITDKKTGQPDLYAIFESASSQFKIKIGKVTILEWYNFEDRVVLIDL